MKRTPGPQHTTHYRSVDPGDFSRATEEYLRLIYDLSGEATGTPRQLSTSRIAEALDVRPASVTAMIQKLASEPQPLVNYEKHRGVLLTEAGRRTAIKSIRNHRLLEQFLFKVMGFPFEKVHEEALKLQHSISSEFTMRMAKLLGEPSFDPHGAPIPDGELNLPFHHTILLVHAKPGTTVRIASLPDDDPHLLKRLKEGDCLPGSDCTVSDAPEDETIFCTLQSLRSSTKIPLSRQVAEQISIEPTARLQ